MLNSGRRSNRNNEQLQPQDHTYLDENIVHKTRPTIWWICLIDFVDIIRLVFPPELQRTMKDRVTIGRLFCLCESRLLLNAQQVWDRFHNIRFFQQTARDMTNIITLAAWPCV